MDTYEVEWRYKDQPNYLHKTRVTPGTPESAANFIKEREQRDVEIVRVLKEINVPRDRTCGYCRQTRTEYTIRYEECKLSKQDINND